MRLSPKAGLWLVLAVSLALRVWLAAGGGQGYWPDENMRYGESQTAAAHLLQGEWGGVAKDLLSHADHLLFRWVALPAALLDAWLGASAFRAACYFSLFSTAAIGLIWGIVRRVGGGEAEALLAAGLAACASSLFFYARHFFPYDAAIALLLGALWMGLGGRQWWRAGLAGVVVGAGFLTYNGYWLLGATVLGVVVVEAGADWRRFAGRTLLAGAGLLGSVGGMVLVSRCAGYDLLQAWRENAATITQGDFGQGWRVILEYLWFTEGPLAVIWAAALGCGAWLAWRTRDAAVGRWLGAVVMLVAGLIVLSDLVPKFVVYGRLVRPLVPFLCLLTARVVSVGRDREGWPDWLRPGLLVAAAGCAAWSFAAPLGQTFPADFLVRARREAVQYQRQRPGVLQVLHAEHLWGIKLQSDLPAHEVILRAAHPLQFRPYQYEGFSAEQRADFSRHDIAMKLVCLSGLTLPPGAADDAVSPPYYGPIKLRVRFPAHAAGRSEPLVSTGRTRKGDILFVRYVDEDRVCFGIDHWSAGEVLSEPVGIEPGREYELLLSLGSLLPEDPGGSLRAVPWINELRRLAFVALDGKPVFSVRQKFHASAPEEAFVAGNFIGGSVARREFTGTVTGMARASLRELERWLPFARPAMAGRDSTWEGAAGPWRLRFRLPQDASGVAEPLFSVRTETGGEWLLLEKVDATRIRVRLERTDGVYWSTPFTVNPAGSQEVLFSTGGLYPDGASQFFQQHPQWRPLKRLTFVSWNGGTVLLRNLVPLAGPARETVFGAIPSGGVSAREHFSGLMEEMEPVGPDRILRASIHVAGMVGQRPAEWGGYPGPVRLRLRLPEVFPADGVGEPLLVGGVPGAGDLLAVLYGTDGRVRISLDHWGTGGMLSEPVRIEPGAVCEILVTAGFLWPPEAAPLYRNNPALRELRPRVIVAVDGRTVLDAPAVSHAATPDSLTLGVNFIGGSTTAANFTGIIEGIEPAEIPDVLRLRR